MDLVESTLLLYLGEAIVMFPFFCLGTYQSKEMRKLRYALLMIVLDSLVSQIDGSLYGFAVLFVFWLAFSREYGWRDWFSLFLSTYLFLAYQSIRYFFLTFLYSIDGFRWSDLLNILLVLGINAIVLIMTMLLLKAIRLDFQLLRQEELQGLVRFSTIFFSMLSLLRIVASYFSGHQYPGFKRYEMVISLFFFLIFLLWALHIRNRETAYRHDLIVKRIEDENRALQKTVNKLGSLYDNIRAFRHDFAGMIAILEPAIVREDLKEIEDIYRNVLLKTNERLRVVDYTAFNLKNIEDIAFRNTLAQAMIEAEESYIPFSLEVIGVIHRVHVPMLEVIRMMNILLKNALEGAREAAIPQIQVSLVEENSGVTCIIRNTRRRGPISQRLIWEKGYSTRGSNRGLGLPTLQALVEECEGVYLETLVEEVTFTQTLIFDREDKDENFNTRR